MSPLEIDFQKIPAELKALRQWVCWELTTNEKDKLTKVPKIAQTTSAGASTANPKTWSEFSASYSWFASGHFSGIGFVFSIEDPYCGIDLDGCRNPESGTLKPWAKEIVERFNSYTEASQSGKGVHIIIKAGLLGAGLKRELPGTDHEVEIYDRGRFFAFTGKRLKNSTEDIEDRQAEVDELYMSLTTGEDKEPGKEEKAREVKQYSPVVSDEEIIKLASEAKNGDKFKQLMDGEVSGYRSDSEADGGLSMIVVFWTQDFDQWVRIIERSGLWDEKWDRDSQGRKDYQERTFQTAYWKQYPNFWSKSTTRAVERAAIVQEDTSGAPEQPAEESQIDTLLTAEPISLTGLLGKKLSDPKMVLGRGLVPANGYTILASYTKIGKTTLTMQMCLSIASGNDFLGFPVESRPNVLYCYLENTEQSIAKLARSQIAGWGKPLEYDDLNFVDSRGMCLTLQSGIDFLRASIEKTSAELVVIDPVTLAMQNDMNDISVVRRLVQILQKISMEFDVAWLLIHHYSKPNIARREPIQQIHGSSGWGNFCESFIGIERYSQQRSPDYKRLTFKLRHGRELADICVYLNPETRLFEVVDDPEAIPGVSIDRVLDIMKEHGQPLSYTLLTTLVQTKLSISERRAKELISSGKELGKIVKAEGRYGKYFLF